MNWSLAAISHTGATISVADVTPAVSLLMEQYPNQADAHIDLVMKQEARRRGASYASLLRREGNKTTVEADYWLN